MNTMAGNLAAQGFCPNSCAAAMDGDFTRFITVEEKDSLKTQINQVFNLRDSTAGEAAELANRSKSEFPVNMLHEIR